MCALIIIITNGLEEPGTCRYWRSLKNLFHRKGICGMDISVVISSWESMCTIKIDPFSPHGHIHIPSLAMQTYLIQWCKL